ncbi:MAG TPA: hypothetical protein VMU48_03945 [Terracidiphilus sp.]|nr:hypothetical protein [Terracidiphilus sp.]
MKTRNLMLSSAICIVLVSGGVTMAQERHPNIAAAQHLIDDAIGKIDAAQAANHDHLGDHAQKAKQLLMEAKGELRAAAEFADHH